MRRDQDDASGLRGRMATAASDPRWSCSAAVQFPTRGTDRRVGSYAKSPCGRTAAPTNMTAATAAEARPSTSVHTCVALHSFCVLIARSRRRDRRWLPCRSRHALDSRPLAEHDSPIDEQGHEPRRARRVRLGLLPQRQLGEGGRARVQRRRKVELDQGARRSYPAATMRCASTSTSPSRIPTRSIWTRSRRASVRHAAADIRDGRRHARQLSRGFA